jgi:hypothetical protein
MTHQENKQKIATALGLKWFTGRNADWGGASLLSIKGNEFYGIFIIDMNTLTGDEHFIVMSRIFNSQTEECEDTDIIHFDSEKDDVNLFIEKLSWV